MPYPGEVASKTSQATTIRDATVSTALGRYRIAGSQLVDPASIDGLTVALKDLGTASAVTDITTCLSIDGSRQETPVGRFGNVVATVGFVRVAVASVDLKLQREVESEGDFVNNQRLIKARAGDVLSYALPGVGLRAVDANGLLMGTAQSWRHACNDMLAECSIDGVSLADALLTTHAGINGDLEAVKLPVPNCPECGANSQGRSDGVGSVARDGGPCMSCGAELLLVDFLNVDDLLATHGRENALNLVMDFTERLTLVATIESIRRRGLDVLAQTAIVVDGPLSALRISQRMVKPILSYFDEVSSELEVAGHGPLLLIGVEKTGQFVEHAAVVSDLIEPGHIMKLPTDYIATHVTGRTGRPGSYGQENFYGRRFFYRRLDGHMLVVTVPARSGVAPWSFNAVSEDWDSYPALATVVGLLEELRSDEFGGAVQPLLWAHRASSLALSAADALARLSQDQLGIEQNTRLRLKGAWN